MFLHQKKYYPFGLEMKAISSQAAMKMQTNYKFNGGTELEASFDVDYYETYFRNYDPQIGRFTGIDIKAWSSMNISPYHFSANNPISFNDPLGDKYEPPEITDKWTYGYHDPFAGMFEFTTYMSSGGGSYTPYYDPEYGYADGPDVDGSEIANSKYGGYYNSDGSFVAFTGQQALNAGIAYNNLHNSWGNTVAGSAYVAQTIYNVSTALENGRSNIYGGSGRTYVGLEKLTSDWLPMTASQFNAVYNDGYPYDDYKPCSDGYFNQCAIRTSKALKDCGLDLSDATGPRCSHGDLIRVADIVNFLKDNFSYIEIDNPNHDPLKGEFIRDSYRAISGSCLVALMGFAEPDGNGGYVSGNHLEFIYGGAPKSNYENIWNPTTFLIFTFKP